MRRPVVIALLAALAAGPSSAQLPDTPAAHQLAGWLNAFNSGDRDTLRQFLSANAAPGAQRLLQPSTETIAIRERTGGFDLRRVEASSADHLSALAQQKESDQIVRLTIDVEPAAPNRIKALSGATTGPIAPVAQWAALAAATGPQDIVDEYREIYNQRRLMMMGGLRDLGFTFGDPQGAFFIYTDASSSGIQAFELSYLLLREGHVLIFPGTAFGDKWVDWLRISLLQPQDQLALALERMAGVLKRHR